jgi:hypothetical protein
MKSQKRDSKVTQNYLKPIIERMVKWRKERIWIDIGGNEYGTASDCMVWYHK